MRHWTIEQLNTAYESLRAEWHALNARRPATAERRIEKYRSLAAVELRFADVVTAAAEGPRTTFLEYQSLMQAARYRRTEAERYRSWARSDELVLRRSGA